VSELDRELIRPLFESTLRDPSRLTLIAPGSHQGLSVSLGKSTGNSSIPFDERALEDRSVPVRDLWQYVELGITTDP